MVKRNHPPRKLSNYLLNKSLQLRYVAFVTVMSNEVLVNSPE